MNTIKVMHLLLSLDIGGLETFVLSIVKKADRTKFNTSVCSMSPNGKLVDEFKQTGTMISVVEKKQGIDYSLSLRLAKLLRQEQIQIIHTHNSCAWLYGGIAAKIAGIQLIHTEHSNPSLNEKRILLAERALAMITNTIICDSEDVANFMVHKQKIGTHKIKVILNGIDVEMFQKNIDIIAKRAEFHIDADELVIGSVGRLALVKDYLTLIKAFQTVKHKIGKCKLLIVGDGVLRAELEAYVDLNELKQNVIFLGSRRDVPEIIPIFNVFVLSSLSEGLPIALLEAMAAGIPVVATKVGGIPEVIIDGRTGLLVPSRSPEELAEAILAILLDRKKAVSMGIAGRGRVEEQFNLKNTSRRYEQVYDETINTAKSIGL